jgi:hypothetical protein
MERMNGRPDEEVVSDFDQTNDEVHGLGGDDGGDLGADPEVQEPAEGDVLDEPDEWIPMAPQQQGVAWPLVAGLADGDRDDEINPGDTNPSGLSEEDRDEAVTDYSEEGRV